MNVPLFKGRKVLSENALEDQALRALLHLRKALSDSFEIMMGE